MKSISEQSDAIRQWDGKSTTLLTEFYARHREDPELASTLATLLSIQDFQRGASWLLKHHIDKGHAIDLETASVCYASLEDLTHWDTNLHILQAMHALPIDTELRDTVHTFVANSITSERTLIRAWAYTGFVVLARQHPNYRTEAKTLLKQAKETETAGSIVVRIRRGLAELTSQSAP